MPTPSNPLENPSTYFINPEEAAETSRLLLQDRIITKEMGGVFPASLDLSHIYTVLDLACGPGGWALDVVRAIWLAGKSFSPDGKRFGTTLILSQFLREAGLGNIQHQAYALDYSYGTEAHETMYQNTMITYPLLLPFLLKMGVTTREEFDRLYEQIAAETQEPEYRGLWFYLSVWGTRPGRS